MGKALVVLRSIQLLGLFIAMVLVVVGHGLCGSKAQSGHAVRNCSSERISIDMWPYGQWVLNLQFGVFGMSLLGFFGTVLLIMSAVAVKRKKMKMEDNATWAPLVFSLMSLFLACMEGWMSVRGYDYSAADKLKESKLQNVVYVESWVAATLIYLVVSVLYLSDWCLFYGHRKQEKQKKDEHSGWPEIKIPDEKVEVSEQPKWNWNKQSKRQTDREIGATPDSKNEASKQFKRSRGDNLNQSKHKTDRKKGLNLDTSAKPGMSTAIQTKGKYVKKKSISNAGDEKFSAG